MTSIPKLLSKEHFPGLEDEHELALSGVGVCEVTYTLAINTARTAAQLLASPPNTAGLNIAGPVVHSLGTAPKVVIPMVVGPVAYSLTTTAGFQYCTADNSAVYLWPTSATGDVGGVNTRVVMIR